VSQLASAATKYAWPICLNGKLQAVEWKEREQSLYLAAGDLVPILRL